MQTDYLLAQRNNAMRHGIVSQQKVLPWENEQEYESLLNALMVEYHPVGVSEQHLVEELANIFWRKKRWRIADHRNAYIKLFNATKLQGQVTAKSALCGVSTVLKDEEIDLSQLIKFPPEEVAVKLEEAIKALADLKVMIQQLIAGEVSFEEVVDQLPEDVSKWCHQVKTKNPERSAKELARFLEEHFIRHYKKNVELLQLHGLLCQQAYAMSFCLNEVDETLSRYENHLDRKFEKTLAILLKLQETRAAKKAAGLVLNHEN